MKESKRLEAIEEYYFSGKLREIAALRASGAAVINLGIGSPDLPPHPSVAARLADVVKQADGHSYQPYRGIVALREAIADFYATYFGVDLDSASEILPLMGSKEGIMHVSMAFVNPGDEVLLPQPGYMTYRSATLLAGGVPRFYELSEMDGYLPDYERLEDYDLSKVKLMWVNYPHMPTGAKATERDFEALVDFASRHDILLVNDNPYSFILNDNPVSILQVSGAKSTALELNSLSKSHNMAGWRVGWLMGSAAHVDTVMRFKSQMDSGMFYAVQQAAVTALKLDMSWFENLNKTYGRRKKLVLKIVDRLGLSARQGQSGMFVWAQLPAGENSKDFTERLLNEHHIFLAPGFIFGKSSDNFVRLSLTVGENELQEAVDRLD